MISIYLLPDFLRADSSLTAVPRHVYRRAAVSNEA